MKYHGQGKVENGKTDNREALFTIPANDVRGEV